MMVVVVYDIAVSTKAGAARLQKVCKKCLDRGVRVQESVFECQLNADQYRRLKEELSHIIDPKHDSLRFYLLGNHYQNRIEQLGQQTMTWDRETYVI